MVKILDFNSVRNFSQKSQKNHESKASDLQTFRVFSQHHKWVITPVNP